MKKRVLIIVFLVLFISVISLGVYLFAKNVREDQQLTKEKMKEISAAYNVFNKDIEKFASDRETLYKNLQETYLENLESSYETWNKYMDDYAITIKKIEKDSKTLKKSCFIKFASIEINNKCTNFKANYEAAMNYYIADVKNYNKMVVKEYNDWAKNNGKENQLLNEAKLVIYKDYIDFDKDGEYFGKEDEGE